jgi:hypothetical protein
MSMRIKFHKKDEKMFSVKIYSNGQKMVRLVIDTHKMEYQLVDPVTGYIHDSGGGVTNLEVLQRKAKKAIKVFLNIEFEKEVRNVSRTS